MSNSKKTTVTADELEGLSVLAEIGEARALGDTDFDAAIEAAEALDPTPEWALDECDEREGDED